MCNRALATVCSLAGLLYSVAHPGPTPAVRIVDSASSTTGTRLDLLIDDAVVAGGVRSGATVGPFHSNASRRASVVVRKQGSMEPLLTIPVNLKYQDHVIALVGNPDEALDYGDIGMDFLPPPSDQPQIGVLNMVDGGAFQSNVDLYVAKANEDISMRVPDAKSFARKASTIVTVAPGSYRVIFTVAGAKDVVYSTEVFQTSLKGRTVAVILPRTGAVKARAQFLNLGPGVQ